MKTLIWFGVGQLKDMVQKGNIGYARHYEAYFDKVYVVYLLGRHPERIKQGKTTLISLGKGKRVRDLLFAPCRIFKLAKEIKPTSYLTADLVFSWWTSILLRWILGAKIILMPVCIPENIYQTSKQTMSFLPKALERLMTKGCFLSADKVLTTYALGAFVDWLRKEQGARNKLIIIETFPETLPSLGFFEELKKKELKFAKAKNNYISLLYVGRLHKEKLVEDLIWMLKKLKELQPKQEFSLTITGDGPEKTHLLELAQSLKIDKNIKFLGYVRNKDLINYYLQADIYVSPLTGTSLREAALCGLPVVAYNTDWIKGLLKHTEHALLVPVRDIEKLAQAVIRLSVDEALRVKIAKNLNTLAWKLWNQENLHSSLKIAFESR